MDAAQAIRQAVARVAAIRREVKAKPSLTAAIANVKAFQARRFTGTYSDLLASAEFGAATRFFLNDLYSDKDYTERDAQFSRIAGALQTLFPQQVVATAVSLSQLHLLTEELDLQMADAWLRLPADMAKDPVLAYTACWQAIGCEAQRIRQLEIAIAVGKDLDRLTRTHGLRLMLRMMRRPALAAGLGSLQEFLELGFDTFAQMSGGGHHVQEFLSTIDRRERTWIQLLSYGGTEQCHRELRICLSQTT